MKKLSIFIIASSLSFNAHAVNLIDVYHDAQLSDPIYQQAISKRYASKEGFYITLASLLPSAALTATPNVARTSLTGSNIAIDPNTGFLVTPKNVTVRGYTVSLSINQTVFDFAKISRTEEQHELSKQADAMLNVALQDLMMRVSKAYFAVLRDEEYLQFSNAAKIAYSQQYNQVKQQYNVGLKNITNLYTAQASYDSALANYISAQTMLANDKENLRVITGHYYTHLDRLSDAFPLVIPTPNDVSAWVNIALQQNWSIKAACFGTEAARLTIHEKAAGHLPTVNLIGSMDKIATDTHSGYKTLINRDGFGTQSDRQIALSINVPLLAGGGVIAATNQAVYQFENSEQQLEQVRRDVINATRQSFNGIVAGISQIKADQLATKSSVSSLQGMEESYHVGTETLINVLNQRQNLYHAQTQYASDRYAFIINILTLKQAAGTLSLDDLIGINAWLGKK